MEKFTVIGADFDIIWKDKAANFQQIENLPLEKSTDLLLLPEMFSTGFCMTPEETADDHMDTLKWMQNFARLRNIAVCGSVAVKENDNYYNRMYFVEPSGTYYSYDKRHLFSYSGENQTYTPGTDRVIITYKDWRILLQICYDLRFPVFSRNEDDYDLAVYVANWPKSRIDAWNTLLKARAIENQAYVFGLNRTGTDGNNLEYPTSSSCFFADGSIISKRIQGMVTAELELNKLQEFRRKFPFLSDRDSFTLK